MFDRAKEIVTLDFYENPKTKTHMITLSCVQMYKVYISAKQHNIGDVAEDFVCEWSKKRLAVLYNTDPTFQRAHITTSRQPYNIDSNHYRKEG